MQVVQGGSIGSSGGVKQVLTWNPAKGSVEGLQAARQFVARTLVTELKVDSQKVPSPPNPPTLTQRSLSESTPSTSFDPFKTSSFNTMSAAVGAQATSIVPDGSGARGKSTTERQLDYYQSRQTKMEEEMKAQLGENRGMVAFRPGEAAKSNTSSSGGTVVDGKSDGALLAGLMKRREEERKRKEEGGFTTKAMRTLLLF